MNRNLSIIIPCYNEEENIKECLSQISSLGLDAQILVIDDGSEDRTPERARESDIGNLRVIRNEKHSGKGAALRTGLEYATGEIAVIFDADYTCLAAEIPAIISPIIEGRADFVNSTRFIYPMEKRAMNLCHRLSNKLTALFFSLIIGRHITDSLCGMKAFKREMLKERLKENSWPDFELLIKAKKSHMRIVEIPVHYRARKAGASKMNTLKGIYSMPMLLIKSLMS